MDIYDFNIVGNRGQWASAKITFYYLINTLWLNKNF